MEINIHIGRLIQLKLEEQGRTASWLAEKAGWPRSYIYKRLKRSNIQSNQLFAISEILEFNFFSYYSDLLEKHLQD